MADAIKRDAVTGIAFIIPREPRAKHTQEDSVSRSVNLYLFLFSTSSHSTRPVALG